MNNVNILMMICSYFHHVHQKSQRVWLFSITIAVIQLLCTPCTLKNYPENFPPEIMEKTSDLEKIISKYRSAVEDSLKKKSEFQFHNKRPKESIMKTVMQNLPNLRYAYNRRLRELPGLYGKITVKYLITGNGDVYSAEVVSTTMNDINLENDIKSKILDWKFDPLNVIADTTEVFYPFVFTQGQFMSDILKKDLEQGIKGDRSSDDVFNGWKICNEVIEEYLDWYATQQNKKSGIFSVRISITKQGFVENLEIKNSNIESKEPEIELLKTIRALKFTNCSECNGYTVADYTFSFIKQNN